MYQPVRWIVGLATIFKGMNMNVDFSQNAKSNIQWEHIDGPVFHGKDGYIHWLTLLERLMFKCGAMKIEDLEKKYQHGDQRG